MRESIGREEIMNVEQLYIKLTDEWHQEWCKGNEWTDPSNGRRGIFGASLTIWLMMLQGLSGKSMKGALSLMQQGAAELVLSRTPRGNRAQRLSPNTGGFSQAKQRLPLSDVEDAVGVINEGLKAERGKELLYGYRVVAIDGTDIIAERTKDIERVYPRGDNSCGELNHPDVLTVFATDVVSGVTSNPEIGPMRGKHATNEAVLGGRVIEKLEPGTLLLGDRGFGIFSVISHAHTHKQHVLFRLMDGRARKFLVGESKTGNIDKKVTWSKSRQDQMLSPQDPLEVEGRIVRITLRTPGYRPLTLLFFTTTDLPVEHLVELYGKRVTVETDIRYLKKTFKIERLYSRTADNLAKEMLVRFCAFNLARRVIANVAQLVKLQPREIGFTHALMYIGVFGYKIQNAESTQKREELMQDFLRVMRQGKLPNRKKHRHEPRKVTHNGERFPVLRGTRTAAAKLEIAKKRGSK